MSTIMWSTIDSSVGIGVGLCRGVDYGRPFVPKLVMTTLCKKWVISRDKLLPSCDYYDTSRDN